MRHRALFFICIVWLTFHPISAEDSPPIPNHLVPITPENIAQIKEIGRLSAPSPESLVWSPDSHHLAVGTSGDIRVYDIRQPVAAPLYIDSPYATRHEYNLSGDLIINNGQVWETLTGQVVTGDWRGEISPSGNLGVTVEEGGHIETLVSVWNTHDTTAPLHVLKTGIKEQRIDVIFSPDERTIAVTLSNEWESVFNPTGRIIVQLWNIEVGKKLTEFDIKGGRASFSLDGSLLISTSAFFDAFYGKVLEGMIQLHNTQTGQEIFSAEPASSPLAMSANGQRIAFKTVTRLLESSDQVIIRESSGQLRHLAASESIQQMGFSPDGRYLAGWNDQTFSVWDLNHDSDKPLFVHPGMDVTAVYFSTDARFLVTYGWDENHTHTGFQIWNTGSGELLTDLGDSNAGFEAVFSPDGRQLALGSTLPFDGMTSLWDISNANEIKNLYHFDVPVRFSPDWKHGAYWDETTGTVHVLDFTSKEAIRFSVLPDYLGSLWQFDPLNEQALFSPDDQTFRLVNLRSREMTADLILEGQNILTVSSNGHFLAAGRSSDTLAELPPLAVYDLENPDMEPISINTTSEVWTTTFSPDGLMLAVNNPDGFVELWDTMSGKMMATWATSVYPFEHEFSPDGRWLVTHYFDTPVQLWDIAETAKQVDKADNNSVNGILGLTIDDALPWRSSALRFSSDGAKIFLQVDRYKSDHTLSESGGIVINLAAALASGELKVNLNDFSTVFAPAAQNGNSFFSPNGHWLVTNNQKKPGLFLWNTETGEEIFAEAGSGSVLNGAYSVFFSSDSRLMGVQTSDGQVVWRDTATFRDRASQPVYIQNTKKWEQVGFNANDTLMFVADNKGTGIWGVVDNGNP
jgi:WD40 repeat protein